MLIRICGEEKVTYKDGSPNIIVLGFLDLESLVEAWLLIPASRGLLRSVSIL